MRVHTGREQKIPSPRNLFSTMVVCSIGHLLSGTEKLAVFIFFSCACPRREPQMIRALLKDRDAT